MPSSCPQFWTGCRAKPHAEHPGRELPAPGETAGRVFSSRHLLDVGAETVTATTPTDGNANPLAASGSPSRGRMDQFQFGDMLLLYDNVRVNCSGKMSACEGRDIEPTRVGKTSGYQQRDGIPTAQSPGAEILGISERQLRRVLAAYRRDGMGPPHWSMATGAASRATQFPRMSPPPRSSWPAEYTPASTTAILPRCWRSGRAFT